MYGPAHRPCGRPGTSPRVTLSICPHQVVGVKDSRMGEEICACIRLRAGQDCTQEEIKAFCKGKVGSQSSVSFQTSTPSGCWGLVDESPWISSTGGPSPDSARLFLSGCVALVFFFPDLAFQDPTLRCVCEPVPTHCVRQGKRGLGQGRSPGTLSQLLSEPLSLLSALYSRFRNTS